MDGGNFDWAASGRYPAIAAPNPSYHGVSFTQAAGRAAFVTYVRAVLLRDTGAAISPFAAFLLLQGIETLSLRLERHGENTRRVVEYLAGAPSGGAGQSPVSAGALGPRVVPALFSPGGGSIFTFEIRGGVREAHRFIDRLELFSLLANVADAKSLVIHPATTTHSQLTEEALLDQGIRPNTIRLSVGTEHIDDLLADLGGAFRRWPGRAERWRIVILHTAFGAGRLRRPALWPVAWAFALPAEGPRPQVGKLMRGGGAPQGKPAQEDIGRKICSGVLTRILVNGMLMMTRKVVKPADRRAAHPGAARPALSEGSGARTENCEAGGGIAERRMVPALGSAAGAAICRGG